METRLYAKEPTLNGLCILKQMLDRAIMMARYSPGEEDVSVYQDIFENKYKEKILFPSLYHGYGAYHCEFECKGWRFLH